MRQAPHGAVAESAAQLDEGPAEEGLAAMLLGDASALIASQPTELALPAAGRPSFAQKLTSWSGSHDFVQSILLLPGCAPWASNHRVTWARPTAGRSSCAHHALIMRVSHLAAAWPSLEAIRGALCYTPLTSAQMKSPASTCRRGSPHSTPTAAHPHRA